MQNLWLKTRLRELDKTQIGLARHLGIEHPRISEFIRGEWQLPSRMVSAMAEYLEMSADELLQALSTLNVGKVSASTNRLLRVRILGNVQAGIWREAVMYGPTDITHLDLPADPDYPEVERFGLINEGPSMNRLIPEGAVAICILLQAIERDPIDGEIVVIIRRTTRGLTEASLKEYVVDPVKGAVELWPRSFHPDWQKPITLETNGEEDDVQIQAVVRGHYRDNRPRRR